MIGRQQFVIARRQSLAALAFETERSLFGKRAAIFIGSPAPSCAEEDNCRVTFCGTLHNGPELARLCGIPAVKSDATLLLAAYRKFGEQFVGRLRGIFAFLLEHRSGMVLAARDRAGVFPLFYGEASGQLLFATSVPQLLKHSAVRTGVNRAALADSLSHRGLRTDETFFSAIRRLPPGHILRRQDGHTKVSRYWDPASADRTSQSAGEDELGQFDSLLDQAVGRCLQSAPAGVFLSGSVDSLSIAAVAAEHARKSSRALPRAFGLAHPHADCNEEALQRAMAGRLELPLNLVPFETAVGSQGLLASSLALDAWLSAPLQNVWLPACLYLAAQARQAGCRVILSPPFSPAFRDHLRANGVRRLAGSAAASVVRKLAPVLLRKPRLAAMIDDTPDWLAPDPELSRELKQRAEQRTEEELSRPGQSRFERDLRAAFENPLKMMEAEESFEYSQIFGLRILCPSWDVDLVSFLSSLPAHPFHQDGRSQGLMQNALARRFPELRFEPQKSIAASVRFFQSTVLSQAAPCWEKWGARSLARLGIVEPQALRDDVQSVLSRAASGAADSVWDVMNLEAWLRPRCS
ncbi:MAG TPA: asparagine synthase-related protein [Bryobacteraceae bacterium]|nr:asparagine synthase-related protein [Bryobacteraceae bacterium]